MTALLAHAALPRPATAEARSDFNECYEANFQRLALQLYAYLGDLHEAEDVVQEAFCRAYAKWKTIAGYDDPAAWVRKVAFNLATSRLRKRTTMFGFLARQREEHTQEPSPDRVALARALATIPPRQRRAVVLHYMAGLSIAEISAQEGAAEGTVKSWLSRGRVALGQQLTGKKGNRDV